MAFRFYVVLAYLPAEKEKPRADHTILPDLSEKIENIPPRFAINYRNKFMLEAADVVVTYVKHSWGEAAKYKRLAEKKNRSHRTFHMKTQLTRLTFNSVIHFSTCITSWNFLKFPRISLYFQLLRLPRYFLFLPVIITSVE